MRSWSRNIHRAFGFRRPVRRPSSRLMLEHLEDRTVPSTGFVETPLASNIPGLAPNTDRELINPWGFFETPDGQFRVAANGSGQGILFNAQGQKSGADIIIPPPASSPPGTTSTPNGVINNPTSDFIITVKGRSAPATLLFSTEDGTIAGWNPALSQTRAVIAADQSGDGAVYKLLTMGQAGGANFLYATNFHNGTVDVFDAHFALHTFFAGQFTDPNAPAGFAPFGVKNVNGTLFVTYAKQDAAKHDDVAGPGNGFIDEFTTDGHFITRFASGTAAGGTLTALNSPIGATFAPAGFGSFGGDLLIGNFGDSHVSAFDPSTGQFLGQLQDTSGHPLVLTAGITGSGGNTKGLWGIGFGNGQGGAGTQTLFFADGPNDETDGVFGMVNFDPPVSGPAPAALRTAAVDRVFAAAGTGVVGGIDPASVGIALGLSPAPLVATQATTNASMNGIAGSMPTFYDGGLQTINFKEEPAQAEASLLAHNKSINIIYMSTNPATGQMCTAVINALPAPGEGPGFNPLWQQVDIVFNPGFAPRQFTSDSDILAAAAAGQITLVPTNEVYRCSVVGRKT